MLAQLHFVLFMILVFSSIFFIFFYSHFLFTLGFVNWNSWHTFKRVHKCEMFVWGRVSIMNNKHFFLTTSDPHIGGKKQKNTENMQKQERDKYVCKVYMILSSDNCRLYFVCPWVCLSSQMSERFMDLFIIFFY